ncbi:MAG: peptidase inhibitor family I36 protein [Actinomycetota bacterium]|nr:peptidase inhibitor family I36 protein [Actinomycetota bacterium]
MTTRGSRTAPLIALAFLTFFAVPSPASPAVARAAAECPPKSLCVWAKANFKGDRLVLDKLGASNKIARKMNDRVSSARLRYSGGAAELYEDTNGGGNTLCLLDAPGVRKYPDLSGSGGGYDDMMSSSYLSEEPFGTCF